MPTTDLTDPFVVCVTWFLTWAAGKLVTRKSQFAKLRHVLPAAAVLIAVGARAGVDAVSGSEINADTLLRALASAGVAVLTHSQVREVQKTYQTPSGDHSSSSSSSEEAATNS